VVRTKSKPGGGEHPETSARSKIRLRQVHFDKLMTDLIELDFAHARECEHIGRSGPGSATKLHVINRLRELHRARREPYLRELARVALAQ
jgi:ABC-type phosphate transport system ATPase subunit